MHEIKPLKFDPKSLKGISEKQITLHHDRHYAAYVNGRNKVEEALKAGNVPNMRALKKDESHNASGMALHEVYFRHLGGSGGRPSGKLLRKIEADFGSFEKWKEQFIACASAARGWALLCHDWSDMRLHNYVVDFHDEGAVWGSSAIFALDVWEHAYYLDFGPDRAKYIEAFFSNIDWKPVEKQFEMYSAGS